ncbi:aldehyde dehydrogenase family protein [bacterium]|nr:aldehyde dehydrogenase family protein [bacterium]
MAELPKKNILESFNPATLESLGQVEITLPECVEETVRQAREGFYIWRSYRLSERAKILKRAQQNLLEQAESMAQLITREMGRPYAESLAVEVEAGVDLIGYYAERADKFLKERPVPLHHIFFFRRGSILHFQPLGVLGIISPWNWPLLIPLGGIVPALLSGNSIVFKPSEITPFVGKKIHELFLDAGVPDSVFKIIQGEGRTGAALVKSSVDKVFFTGSTGIGRKVMETAAQSMKKVVLEMGGSDPAIVCEDADIHIASSGVVWGGFNNCGQNCNSVERVYVNYKIVDAFIEAVIRKVRRLRLGNGLDLETDIASLASESQYHKIGTLVSKAVREGAEIRCGGKKLNHLGGYFYEPTVLYTEKPLQSFYREEWFGPVVLVAPVQNDEEAICFANQSAFGLAASVWTRSRRRGMRIARQIESGSVMVNDVIVSFGMTEAGWTGIKNSGVGWVHGEKGLDEMVNIQYINYDPQYKIQKFWWFPYGAAMIEGIKKGMILLFHRNILKRLKSVPGVLKHFSKYLIFNSEQHEKL